MCEKLAGRNLDSHLFNPENTQRSARAINNWRTLGACVDVWTSIYITHTNIKIHPIWKRKVEFEVITS